MIKDKSTFIREILDKTKSKEIQFRKHPKLIKAFIWDYVLNDGTSISITVDKYEANFRSKMAPCVNMYISGLKSNENIVRCLHSEGSFKQEYDMIDEIYKLCEEHVSSSALKLENLELQLAS